MNKIAIQENIEAVVSAPSKIQLQESAAPGALPEKITTIVEAIHSGLTRNYTFYPSDNLERSVESWTRPYNKPVIKNHDIYEEPLGRVMSAGFKQSNISPDKHTIELELEITDPETIRKVMDGRYQTLSIGGSANSATCSVCGKDLVKEGYCGHQKGRTYEGKQAYWIIGEMDFDEISWVNVPADRSAQVIQKNVVKAAESADTANQEGGTGMQENADILEQIDNLTGVAVKEENEPEQTPPATEPETPEAGEPDKAEPETGAGEPDENPETPEEGKGDQPDAAKLQEELTQLKERVEQIEAENITLLAERDDALSQVEALNTENGDLKQKVADLEAELVVANEESAASVKQNVQLASYTHKALAENVANLQLVLGETAEADFQTTLVELSKETSRSLKEKAQELTKKRPQRVIEHVTNPLHDGGDTTITESASQDQALTMEAYLEKVNKAFNKSQYQNQ